MNKLCKAQEDFFLALSRIQISVVLEYLKKNITEYNVREALYDVTFETICGIMSLLDGYESKSVQLDIIDKATGESLRTGIELHDKCVDYLKTSLDGSNE